MKKITILIFAVCSLLQSQNIAYVDSKYILEKIPDFESAQEELNLITLEWQEEIDLMKKEVEQLYRTLQTEQYLLPDEKKIQREEAINC